MKRGAVMAVFVMVPTGVCVLSNFSGLRKDVVYCDSLSGFEIVFF